MALAVSSIIAIVGIVIGIILLIIGIIFFEINRSNSKSQPWWVWLLMIGGAVLAIIGGIFLAFSLRDTGKTTTKQQVPVVQQPPQPYPYTPYAYQSMM